MQPSPTPSEAFDIGIFWDYENVRVPSWSQAADASNAIRDAVQNMGLIVERKLYRDQTQDAHEAVNLSLAGWSLVDCPKRYVGGKVVKETLDKMMIVDIMFFAPNWVAL